MISYDAKLAKDPDELIRKSVDHWKEAIINARPLMEWIYGLAFEQNSSSTPEGKKKIAEFILNECKHIQHPVERDAWLMRLAKDLDVSIDALRASLKIANKQSITVNHFTQKNQQKTENASKKPIDSEENIKQLEQRWLAVVLSDESLFMPIDVQWHDIPHAQLYNLLLRRYNARVPDSPINTPIQTDEPELKRLIDFLTIYADKEFESQDKVSLESERVAAEQRLAKLNSSRCLQNLEQQMHQAERLGDTEQINNLLEQISKLNSQT